MGGPVGTTSCNTGVPKWVPPPPLQLILQSGPKATHCAPAAAQPPEALGCSAELRPEGRLLGAGRIVFTISVSRSTAHDRGNIKKLIPGPVQRLCLKQPEIHHHHPEHAALQGCRPLGTHYPSTTGGRSRTSCMCCLSTGCGGQVSRVPSDCRTQGLTALQVGAENQPQGCNEPGWHSIF